MALHNIAIAVPQLGIHPLKLPYRRGRLFGVANIIELAVSNRKDTINGLHRANKKG